MTGLPEEESFGNPAIFELRRPVGFPPLPRRRFGISEHVIRIVLSKARQFASSLLIKKVDDIRGQGNASLAHLWGVICYFAVGRRKKGGVILAREPGR